MTGIRNKNMAFHSFRWFRGFAAGAAIMVSFAFSGCGSRDDVLNQAEGKTIIVATVLPLADWAQEVGGDRVYVQTLLPAGASPHTFDPTPRDMRLISHAAFLLKVGLQMDDWGASLARSTGDDGPEVISLGEQLQGQGQLPDVGHFEATAESLAAAIEGEANAGSEHDHDHDHDHHGHDHHGHSHGGINPHFWLDPVLAAASVEIIRDHLIKADPAGEAIYTANAERYLGELTALDNEIREGLAPYSGHAFVTFHNAWPYLANRYNLEIAAVIEEYAGKAPGEKYLRLVTDRIRQLGIKTVFTEPQLSPRVAEVIASEVGANFSVMDPYGTAGEPDRDTYLKTMRYNLGQLEKAFAASAEQ